MINGRNRDIVGMLSRGCPDVVLSFAADEEGKPAVLLPGHSQILSAWSSVLGGALEAAVSSSSGSRSSSKEADGTATAEGKPATVTAAAAAAAAQDTCVNDAAVNAIPMPGTSVQDWLEVAAFMYPVIPPAQVKWSNLETLLVLGAKLDMPAILANAAAFIQNHMCLLDMAEGGMRFIWKWLPLLDSAGLDEVCALCIERAVQLDKSSCSVESRLRGLSSKALQRLVLCLATDGYCFACTPRSMPRSSYPGAAGGHYKLYNSEEVASILGQELP